MEINIDELIKKTMKEKNLKKLNALRMVKKNFVDAEKEDGNEITDARRIKILQKMSESCKESAELYEKAGRTDEAQHEMYQAGVYDALLPSIPTKDEVKDYIEGLLPTSFEPDHILAMKDMKVIKSPVIEAMPYADGKDIASVVSSLINK